LHLLDASELLGRNSVQTSQMREKAAAEFALDHIAFGSEGKVRPPPIRCRPLLYHTLIPCPWPLTIEQMSLARLIHRIDDRFAG